MQTQVSAPVDQAAVEEERFLADLFRAQPDNVAVMARLALARLRLGQGAAADELALRAVDVAPNDPGALSALGQVHRGHGRITEARQALERAVKLDPRLGSAWLALGEIMAMLPETGAADAAIDAFRRAAALAPRDPRPLAGLAAALMGARRHDEAIAAYRTAIVLCQAPNPADLLNNLGVALERVERRDDAVAALRAAALVRPDSPAILDNLGNALLAVGRSSEAEICHRRALAQGARGAETWSNLGNALHRQGRLDEADSAYRRAIAMQPAMPKFHTNLALNLLLAGRMEEGWREYEWRWREHAALPSYLRDQAWAGEPLPPTLPAGGTLLLQAEQGFGDTLQFVRFVPALKRRGVTRVILACQPELMRIMSTAPELDGVVPETGPLPAFDRALTLMSLPGLLGTTQADIPADIPYLRVPDGAGIVLPVPPEGRAVGLKVGLAWAGRPTHGDDWNRSIPASLLAPLLACPGVTFYSLQRGALAERLGRPPADRVLDAADRCADFADTAALVASLDLLISVDTAVIHMAGALGKPVWLLLPPVPDFRWRMQGDTNPWYPSLRLFRRSFDGGWEPVIAEVAARLRALVDKEPSSHT